MNCLISTDKSFGSEYNLHIKHTIEFMKNRTKNSIDNKKSFEVYVPIKFAKFS